MVATRQRRQLGEAVHATRLRECWLHQAPSVLRRLAALSALRQCLPCELMLEECTCGKMPANRSDLRRLSL
jgi:hypothetical protein